MSFEHFYLTSLFKESNENSSSLEICSAMRNSLARLHAEGLKRLSNTSTNLILEQRLAEYSQKFTDNSEDVSVNSLIGPVDSLTQRKIQTGQKMLWKSKLGSSNFNALDVLQKPEVSGEHCNLNQNLPCNSNVITNANIHILFEKKEPKIERIHQTNKPVTRSFDQHQNGTKTSYTRSDITNNKAAEYGDKVGLQTDNNMHWTTPYAQPKHILKPNSFSHQSNIFLKTNNSSGLQQNNVPSKNLPNDEPSTNQNNFRTARTELMIQNKKKYGSSRQSYQVPENNVTVKRSLGTTRSSIQNKFIPPLSAGKDESNMESSECDTIEDERLKNIDPKMVELIRNEIIDSSAPIGWDDIAGLEFAKTAIQEAVVWPLLRPDIFTGLRRPPKGILFFGPPGTGKTLIGKCIASQCSATFFSISASSLTSKWVGDGEKMVRALFAVARCHQPAVVFIDEIDSLLTQRNDTEHEATRRIKTEFLVQLDGAATGDEDRLLVIGATNRPQELDEAARRRLVKRLYIPLPDINARQQIVSRLMSTERHSLTEENMNSVAHLADGFSGADMRSLCSEAALGPIRAVPLSQITNIHCDQVRPVSLEDFTNALRRVRPSVSGNDLEHYTVWDKLYGSGSNHN